MAQIKKDTSLRKAILQAAITGQLISNVEGTTETGKELLDRIIEERNNKLLADWEEKQTDLFASNDAHSNNAKTVRSEQIRLLKKAKKPALVVASEIDEEEIPFEIPENWCWCRFGEITINRDSERIPLSVSQRELLKKKYDYYGASGIIDKVDNYLFDKDLLLIGEDGANLLTRSTPIAFIASGKYWVNNHAHVIDCNSNYINLNYIKFFINAISLAKYVTGTAQPKMNQEKMNSIPVALPPLAVQNAIVAKLEQVLPLVDAYENAVLQKEELKNALPDKVKKAILQEAITGQLTENWRKSATIKESGKQLLDRIIEERNAKALAEWEESLKKNVGGKATLPSFASKTRAKKPVPVVASEIEEEEIPFEVPESWCWCRLGDLASIARGGSPRPINDFLTNEPDGYNWIKISDTDKGGKFINSTKQKIKKEGLYKTRLIHKGDFLLTNSMSFGRPYISNIEGCIHDGWLVFSFINELINPDFIYHLLSSPFIYDSFSQSAAGGVVQNLNTDKVIDTLVPLPPLEEQEEIVRKVEELLYIFMNI